MKSPSMYQWIVLAGCLVYSFEIKADERVSVENVTTTINHQNMKLLPENCGEDVGYVILREKPFLGEFSWLALLKYRVDDGPQFLCEGFLISNRYVLTAAQCVSTPVYPLVAVRLGEDYINTDPDCETNLSTGSKMCAAPVRDVPIEEVIPHPQYNTNDRNQYNDIALIRLQTPIKFNEFLQPICLPFGDAGKTNLNGKKLWVAGWNKTENFTQSDVKGKAGLPIVEFNQCSDKYTARNVVINNDKEICAGNDLSRWCGVSGSPLMWQTFEKQWYAHGLLSFRPALCNDRAVPEIYTKTFHYLNWILDTIRP